MPLGDACKLWRIFCLESSSLGLLPCRHTVCYDDGEVGMHRLWQHDERIRLASPVEQVRGWVGEGVGWELSSWVCGLKRIRSVRW